MWRKRLFRHRKLVVVTVAGLAIATAWLSQWAGSRPFIYDLFMLLATAVAGYPIVRLAIGGLQARQFTIPLLVTIATSGAIWIHETWEAAAVTFLYVLGSYLEDLTLSRTRAALRSLVDLAPRTARRKQGEELEVISADELAAGDLLVVLPGDRVPADGLVRAGRATLDTAALTGEPLPAEVGPGDEVLGGSVSQGGYLEVEARRVGPDTTFSRLLYLMAEAQEQKPKVQKFLDRFAQWYTPAVVTTAVLLGLITRDIRLCLTFLVIGCPGALVVAAPVAIVAGLGSSARQGILIKGGERLERIGKVDVIAFDKTGTLTQGKPRVATVLPFAGDAAQVLALAAAAEQRSEHHLATAILAHARELGVQAVPATDWRLEPGLGAVAIAALETAAPGQNHTALGQDRAPAQQRTALAQQREILVGNRRLLAAHDIPLSPAQAALATERETAGETIAFVAANGVAVGLIGILDPIRTESQTLVPELKRAGIKRTIMLTGDNRAAAERVGRQLGVDEVRAGLLPQEKVAALKELQAQGHVVAMVGDGINDAPALATADVSIAMGGSGTQAAIEVADIALMSDRLDRVPHALGFSRQIMRVVRQNVAFAVAIVVLLLIGVVTRHVLLGLGMLVHEASILVVILNGMRLLRRARRL